MFCISLLACVFLAESLALPNAGKIMPARMEMMPITTSNSTSVKPRLAAAVLDFFVFVFMFRLLFEIG